MTVTGGEKTGQGGKESRDVEGRKAAGLRERGENWGRRRDKEEGEEEGVE